MNEKIIGSEKNTSIFDGCSSFFMTSSALSCFNGWKNRKNLIENAKADLEFQNELQRQKEVYEDKKEAEEWAFKFWLKRKLREFAQIENSRRLENDLQKAEFIMFFKDWPLQIAIEAINDKRKKDNSGFMPISVVIGKHAKGEAKDPLSLLYASLVDDIKPIYGNLGIKESNIYRFKEKINVLGGAALAYIYSMMSTFPTVVILPSIDERHGKFTVSIGVWNQDSLFPLQKEVLSLDYDSYRISVDKEYLNNKMMEIKMSYIAVASVMNDSYSLVESGKSPVFPEYAIHNSIPTTYPHIMNFAMSEFKSLLLTCQGATRDNLSVEGSFSPYSTSFQKRVEEILSKAIEKLNS